jgi:hypothetical protein
VASDRRGNLDFGAVADTGNSLASVERSGALPVLWQDTWYFGATGTQEGAQIVLLGARDRGRQERTEEPADATTSR